MTLPIFGTAVMLLAACRPSLELGPAPAVEARRPVEILTLPRTDGLSWVEVVIGAGSSRDPVGLEGLSATSWLAATDAIPEGVFAWEPAVDAERAWLRAACEPDSADACLQGVVSVLSEGPSAEAVTVLQGAHSALLERPGTELSAWLWQSWAYQGHPYGHPAPGRHGVLPLVTPERAASFHRAQVVRENVRVGLAGTWTDASRQALEEALLVLPGERAPEAVWFRPAPVRDTEALHVFAAPGTPSRLTVGRALELTPGQGDWTALLVVWELVRQRLDAEAPSLGWPPPATVPVVDPALSWTDPVLAWTVSSPIDRLPDDLVRTALDALRLEPTDDEVQAAVTALETGFTALPVEERLHLALTQPHVAELATGPLRVTPAEARAAWQHHVAEQPQRVVVQAAADALQDGVVIRVPWAGEDAEPWLRIDAERIRRLPPEGVLR